MGFFSFLTGPDINQEILHYADTKNAVLLDVRTPEEYRNGHIPESINLPLQDISQVEKHLTDKSAPLFVYCLSGARSRQAVSLLTKMGYKTVTNIGGISSYKGKVVK